MAKAISALKPSLPLQLPISTPQRPFFFSLPRHHILLNSRLSQNTTLQSTNSHPYLNSSFGFLFKPQSRKFGFSCSAQNEETKSGGDEFEHGRGGESTMPSRFRYLTKEAPDRPVRWPWLIVLAFGIYAWRTVLWELSNWKKGCLAIAHFLGYLAKLALAIVFQFIGPPITSVIRFIETTLYSIRSVYSGIVASAPIQELIVIILLTSTLIAIAEAAVPDSANSQPYLLTLAGIFGFAAVMDFIPELVFWLLLMGMFAFSRFFKKRDLVSSALPVVAVLSAVGQPWLRLVVMTSYVALAIYHHSKKSSDQSSDIESSSTAGKLPAPLLVAALTIGIHVAAKWVRYRHLTWMIV